MFKKRNASLHITIVTGPAISNSFKSLQKTDLREEDFTNQIKVDVIKLEHFLLSL